MTSKTVYVVMARGISKPWTDLNGHTHQDMIIYKKLEGKGAKGKAKKYVKLHQDPFWPLTIYRVVS